jgi:uncharacterized C2H2 Zn-finger protein
MAQDIIIRTLCDVCLASDEERRDARPYRIQDGTVSLEIDLCEIHAKPLGDLIEHARPVKGSKGEDGGACPQCGKVFRSRRGLQRHMTQSHGDDDGGRLAPAAGGVYACDVADCGRAFPSAQGLAMHRFRSHGIRSGESPTGPA